MYSVACNNKHLKAYAQEWYTVTSTYIHIEKRPRVKFNIIGCKVEFLHRGWDDESKRECFLNSNLTSTVANLFFYSLWQEHALSSCKSGLKLLRSKFKRRGAKQSLIYKTWNDLICQEDFAAFIPSILQKTYSTDFVKMVMHKKLLCVCRIEG